MINRKNEKSLKDTGIIHLTSSPLRRNRRMLRERMFVYVRQNHCGMFPRKLKTKVYQAEIQNIDIGRNGDGMRDIADLEYGFLVLDIGKFRGQDLRICIPKHYLAQIVVDCIRALSER